MAANSENAQLLPLLETLEDTSTSHTEQTDAYLSIANRLSGEDGKAFNVLVGKQFSRLIPVFKTHISHQNSDLSNAALQTMGFCVFYSNIASSLSANEVQELLSSLNSIAVKASDKNTCTRALWVISKQHFSEDDVGKAVPSILSTLENVLNKDVQSVVIAYEALNVIIKLLEQTPTQMTDEGVRWAKIILPLVVHSAPKVRLRAATALELSVPLLLQKQQEVATLTEQLMTSKIIGELNKLFSSKYETYVLKLWPLFVKLLGKTLHRSGSFINSLLQLEELGFRNGSPAIKKIAFIAWKSLIDNFALNPEILCSSKRLKLLMQPLSSINVRTEALALTKVEVWWYLLMRLGSQLPVHFEQVCLPLIQSALCVDAASPQAHQLRSANLVTTASTPLQKGTLPFGSPVTPKMNLNSSLLASVAFPSVHLLGIEMMLHFLLGPEVVQFASKHKLVLSLEPLQHPLISSSSFFSKHASTLLNAVQDGFITIGSSASGAVLYAVWKDMIEFVKGAMETGNKKERQGSEVLTCLLQALKNIIASNSLQVEKCLSLLECTVKGLPQKVLGSAAYQVANMDLLNGTPALFLIQLHFHAGILEHGITEERFFVNLENLVSYVFSGPTSPLAFSESVLGVLNQGAKFVENKERLWRMWSILIHPLTAKVNQTNEVNQGDALEHNFSAMHSALMLPISHIFPVSSFPQPTLKTLMRTWSELYKTFARCSSLVTTTDENVCSEELCARILSAIGNQPMSFSLLERIVQVFTVIVDCVNFSPYSTKYQPKTKAPHTPTDWAKKKKGPLGNLNSLMKLLVRVTEEFHTLSSDQSQIEANASPLSSIGSSILNALSACISHVNLPSILRTVFSLVTKPLAVFYMKTKSDSPKVYSSLSSKLDKLLGEVLFCLGSRYTGSYDNDLLEALSPLLCAIFLHKNKQFRTQAAQFWNGSFAKAATLVYPDELKPVLSQVKVKVPLLLPGFTFTTTAGESSGPYSDNMDNSELGAKISGIEVKSTGKRDSLLARAEEHKNKGTPTKPPQAKLKLEFSSPNTKKKILEEEQSMDFVFIPPETTKERVLTEHQKEVLRTKRVDIPTMYNNLDASQDTALFTQYSQSQDNSLDKPEVMVNNKDAAESKEEHTPHGREVKEEETEAKEVADVEMLDAKVEGSKSLNDSAVLNTSKEAQNTSNISNSSTSSDMVLGTPPQPVSRRQSFITLEKFDSSENRSFSPLSEAKFSKAKEVILVPDSQEVKDTKQKRNERENKKNSETESQNDKSRHASRRGSRALRQAKETEKKLEAPEQPNLKCDSESGAVPAEEIEDSECVPESQPPPQEEHVVDHDKENSAPENSIDFKENTPPETNTTVKADTPLPQKSSGNQIVLRRSSRRHSEIIEVVKKEAATEIPQTKEEEKIGLKKTPPSKETPVKQQSEKLVKAEEKNDPDFARNSQESSQDKTSNVTDVKDEELPVSSEKMTRSSSRYQTRRSLQALQTGSEHSESDNSEPREAAGKRKRGRPRKLNESEKAESSHESQIEDAATFDTVQTEKESECASDVASEVDSQLEVDGETYTTVTDNSASRPKFPRLGDGRNTELGATVEINKTYELSKLGSTMQSLMTEPSAGDYSTAVSDVFTNSESTLKLLDCSHKRSRRVRKSKSCECCESSGRQEKSFSEFKSEEAEGKNKAIDSSSDMQFNCTFSVPCAVSTPLVLARQQAFFKVSATEIKSDTESELDQTLTSLSRSETEEVTEICIQTKTVEAMESSTEPSAEVTEIQRDTLIEDVSVEKQRVEEPCAEDKQNDIVEKAKICMTFDIEAIEGSASDEAFANQEDELEDAQSIVVDEDNMAEDKENIDHSAAPSQDFEEENKAGVDKAPTEETEVDNAPAKTESSPTEETEADVERASAEELEAKASVELIEPVGDQAVVEMTETEVGKDLFEGNEAQVKNVLVGETDEEVNMAPPEEKEAEVDTFSVEKEAKGGAATTEATDAEMGPATPDATDAELDPATLDESEAEVDTAPPGETEESIVCQESGEVTVTETSIEVNTLNIDEGNIDLEQENAQRTCEENAETCIFPSADILPNKVTLTEGAKVDEDLTTAAEKCAAPRVSENLLMDLGEGRSNTDSPPKLKGLISMALANDSPSGSFSWSPSASPSTSILKKGIKRQQQEMDSPSPVNKIRRVSFADPIYQEGLADDIDRRSPVVRSNSSNSPSSRSLKMLTSTQPKIITTPTKGFVSPGSRVLGFKSSKKSLISEMTKESMPSPKESVYPALMNCATSIDVILPQITSNMWARGLGQLIRAKNIKTIGDLSTLTPCEIKTLPIRSPKISTVKKALRTYHEQQTKAKGFDEFAALDEAEKPLNGLEEKPMFAEEKLETDLPEASATAPVEAPATPDLPAQINALSLLLVTEELGKYSGSQLFEMQEKLGTMSNCILHHLRSRWSSPPHNSSV
ncbi:PREDICTED: telomere-associated protein RIF1 [Nanorana parkeri]|uniref:telomere-associated protein RIF1 n=1 Tax=Nanorana parkeri TaxID=125878 RepID=UPI00085424B1|nr:PREDICTED: telomere-associated protein RIF1 [Nanorana parkeri]